MKKIGNFINGKLIKGSSDNTIPVYNPTTGEIQSEVILSNNNDFESAVESAKNAFEIMDGSGKQIPMNIINGFVTRMKLPNAKFAFMSTLLGLKNSDLINCSLILLIYLVS